MKNISEKKKFKTHMFFFFLSKIVSYVR